MDFGALAMMMLGLGVTWGGASVCIRIAINKKKS